MIDPFLKPYSFFLVACCLFTSNTFAAPITPAQTIPFKQQDQPNQQNTDLQQNMQQAATAYATCLGHTLSSLLHLSSSWDNEKLKQEALKNCENQEDAYAVATIRKGAAQQGQALSNQQALSLLTRAYTKEGGREKTNTRIRDGAKRSMELLIEKIRAEKH